MEQIEVKYLFNIWEAHQGNLKMFQVVKFAQITIKMEID